MMCNSFGKSLGGCGPEGRSLGLPALAFFPLLLTMFLIISPTARAATASFVQVNSVQGVSVSSVAKGYASSETAGDLNVVVVGWIDTTSSVSSVIDSLGNLYALAAGPVRGNGLSQSIYYARNIKGGSDTVTVTMNQAAKGIDMRILEYKGADTSAPLDVTQGAAGPPRRPRADRPPHPRPMT